MSKELLIRGLKANWYLIVVCLGIFVAAGIWAVKPANEVNSSVVMAAQATTVNGAPPIRTSRFARQTKAEELESAVANYERELAQNRRSPETAANLYRLGNLYYSKYQNYDKASTSYEVLLQDFPDFKMNDTVYPNLATCYERQGKFELERHTYKAMMDYFPKDSEEYNYAKQKLGY